MSGAMEKSFCNASGEIVCESCDTGMAARAPALALLRLLSNDRPGPHSTHVCKLCPQRLQEAPSFCAEVQRIARSHLQLGRRVPFRELEARVVPVSAQYPPHAFRAALLEEAEHHPVELRQRDCFYIASVGSRGSGRRKEALRIGAAHVALKDVTLQFLDMSRMEDIRGAGENAEYPVERARCICPKTLRAGEGQVGDVQT